MYQVTAVVVKRGSGLVSHRPISPNRWQGETDCLVGPFSCRQVAEHFACPAVDFGHYDTRVVAIFAKGDAWYVEIGKKGDTHKQAARLEG